MSTLTLSPPEAATGGVAADGGPTLDEVIVDVWEGLTASRSVACPVCGGEMLPSPAAPQPSGRCTGCGARLS